MKKIILLIPLLFTMAPAKAGFGTELRKAVYDVNLQESPNGQLSKFAPSMVKSITRQEIGSRNHQGKTITTLKKLNQGYQYFPELAYEEAKFHDVAIHLGSAVTAITELQDGRLVCGSGKGILKVITSPGTIDAEITFDGAINQIIELNCPHYSGYIAVLLCDGIALINPDNFDYNFFQIDDDFLGDDSSAGLYLNGFQELRNGSLKGMILITTNEGILVFNTYKKEFFPKVDHDMLNNVIENTFFEVMQEDLPFITKEFFPSIQDVRGGDLFFITRNCSMISCSLNIDPVDSDNIKIVIQEHPNSSATEVNNVYRYLFNKKGLITFSESRNRQGFLQNRMWGKYRVNFPNSATKPWWGHIESIVTLKNNGHNAFLTRHNFNSLRTLYLTHPDSKIQIFEFINEGGATAIKRLKEGNIAIGCNNGNISICTLYDPNLKNLSLRQIALLVNLIKSYDKDFLEYNANLSPFEPRRMFEPSTLIYLHPEWYGIFTTLPAIYQELFKQIVTVDPLSESKSLLSKKSHVNPNNNNKTSTKRSKRS